MATPVESGRDDAPKLCDCGCGKPAPIATRDVAEKGIRKGEPLRFVKGHNGRKRVAPAPEAMCGCGCGQAVPAAKKANKYRNHAIGQPVQFIHGHNARLRGKTPDGAKTCKRCNEVFPATSEFFYPKARKAVAHNPWNNLRQTCKRCDRRRYRDSTPDQKAKTRQTSRRLWLKNRGEITAKRRARSLALRLEMIAAYGGKCTCCGIADYEFLTIEHVNRDARRHKEELGTSCDGGPRIWLDLKRRGWPKDGFTILCMNCNFVTRFGGICPHKKSPIAPSS